MLASPAQSADAGQIAIAAAIVSQVVTGIESDVSTHHLGDIHDRDATLFPAVALLSDNKQIATGETADQFAAQVNALGQQVGWLHSLADDDNQLECEGRIAQLRSTFAQLWAALPPDIAAKAAAATSAYSCAMHPDVTGARGSLCPKCGMVLDQPARLSLANSGLSPHTLFASIHTTGPLTIGVPTMATLVLMRADGSPVVPLDLMVVHTQRIHLLIVDSTLTDYQHIHPWPMPHAGDYTFTFTPHKAGDYHVWADVRPIATGFQEYALTIIPGPWPSTNELNKLTRLTSVVDGLRGTLTLENPVVKANQPQTLKLTLTDKAGLPVRDLEPFMQAFCHLVGFHEDRYTVLHMHPQGAPINDMAARGGPVLTFRFWAPIPGYYRLFAQVQRGGATVMIPFGINVVPAH